MRVDGGVETQRIRSIWCSRLRVLILRVATSKVVFSFRRLSFGLESVLGLGFGGDGKIRAGEHDARGGVLDLKTWSRGPGIHDSDDAEVFERRGRVRRWD